MKYLSHAEMFSGFRKHLHLVVFLALIALLVAGFGMQQSRAPFASAEVQFTDVSARGMHIVPASCPSDQHYVGECAPPTCPSGYVGTPPNCTVPGPSSGCSITSSPDPIVAGQSTSLSWSTLNYQHLGFLSVAPSGTSISPGIGAVNPSGSATVSPTQTTTYTLSGSYVLSGEGGGLGDKIFGLFRGAGATVNSFSCSRTVTVNACPAGYVLTGGTCVLSECPLGFVLQNGACVFNACPSGYERQGNQCVSTASACTAVNYCVGNTLWHRNAQCATNPVQTCVSGCASGACIATPAPSVVTWRVYPSLIQPNETANVEWEVINVRSCEVHGNNNDSWTGVSGVKVSSPLTAQTIFTLNCTGLDNSTVTRTATVNITPIFNEN